MEATHQNKNFESATNNRRHTLTWLMMPNISETMAEILADFFTTECMLTLCILLWRDWSPPARYLLTLKKKQEKGGQFEKRRVRYKKLI